MVEYVDGWNARMARSQIVRACKLCGGKISKKMMYISRDDRINNKRWQHHEHVECQAPWWQVTLTHLLKCVGKLPHRAPPPEEVDPRLEGFDLVFVSQSDRFGELTYKPAERYKQQFLHTPDLSLREDAKHEIELAFGLFGDVIMRAMGNQRASKMLSDVIQQLEQVAAVASNEDSKK